jgi:hypothetical protein
MMSDTQEISWLAIRQPAVIRMLERELDAGTDTDNFAAGLELACHVLSEFTAKTGVVVDRLSTSELERAKVAVASGGRDGATLGWIRQRIRELPVVLTSSDEASIANAIATICMAIEAVCFAPSHAQAPSFSVAGPTVE